MRNTIRNHIQLNQKSQNALIQSKIFEQATNMLGDTFEGMDIERERKENKIEFLENKRGLPDCKVIEEMNRLGLNKIHLKEKEIE